MRDSLSHFILAILKKC